MIRSRGRRERKYEEMRGLLEDLSTQIEEIREEFLSVIDDLEDRIAEVLIERIFYKQMFPIH